MNEESLLKQSLILTGKLVGAAFVWVALISFVAVIVTSRVVGGFSGAPAETKTETTKGAPSDALGHPRTAPAPNPTKPNG